MTKRRCLACDFGKLLRLRGRQLQHNAIGFESKLPRVQPDTVLAKAQEAANIGIQFGDLVVGAALEGRDLAQFGSVTAINGFADPRLGSGKVNIKTELVALAAGAGVFTSWAMAGSVRTAAARAEPSVIARIMILTPKKLNIQPTP
jgi:hypothetical protein